MGNRGNCSMESVVYYSWKSAAVAYSHTYQRCQVTKYKYYIFKTFSLLLVTVLFQKFQMCAIQIYWFRA